MHTKIHLILIACAVAFRLAGQSPQFPPASQNTFGEMLYAHPGSVLGSGSVTRNSPGFLLAGHVPAGQNSGFFIDRLGQGGALFNSPGIFQKQYTVYTGATCNSQNYIQANCSGVTAIETSVPANQQNGTPAIEYAVAGSVSNGCFISFLSNNGNPVNSFFINFALIQNVPSIASVSKPLLVEASSNSGLNEYFLCGTYDVMLPILNYPISVLYAHRINAQGAIIWSRELLCVAGGYMQANAMLESPYTQNLVIVGKTINSGIMVELDAATGGAIVAKAAIYNMRNYTCGFSSIALSDLQSGTGMGYIIGGENQNITPSGGLWMMKVSAAGNVTWNTLIRGRADTKVRTVRGVTERQNLNNGFEYYGVATSTAGAMVIKLNQAGVPLPNLPNEFVYNAGPLGNASTGQAISFSDNTGVDEGLHIFGNDAAQQPTSHYKVQAYFSGHAGCNMPGKVFSYERPEVNKEEIAMTDLNLPLSHCGAISIVAANVPAYQAICGPVGSIQPPASNTRPSAATGLAEETETTMTWNVSPNPVKDKATITLDEAGAVKILLYNNMGQLLREVETDSASNTIELDFSSMGLKSGVYFVSCQANGRTEQHKVVYTGF